MYACRLLHEVSVSACIDAIVRNKKIKGYFDRGERLLSWATKKNNSYIKVTVDLRGVFWGKQYSVLCINEKYINLYITGELI